jgi:ATP-binding cassette subfamily B protein
MIHKGQTTAIVGDSGSGKSTLLKLILKFYKPNDGHISIGDRRLRDIDDSSWSSLCGCVMQEGFIFNDSIERNIAIGDFVPNVRRVAEAVCIANLEEYVASLPQGLKTKIGLEGHGLSGGQKQRILIARAIYKSPPIFLFDEATSSLDAINERIIMENLYRFMKNRTAIIVAHRLSTIKNADQIVVMKAGKVCEMGTHETLLRKGGEYYSLISNQLELAKAS